MIRASDNSSAEIVESSGVSGYVAESVPLALYGAQKIERLGFEEMLKELIRVGGDTDTVASIAGQISGAYLGVGGLPIKMLSKLPEKNLVESIARQFAKKVTRQDQY